MATKAPKLAGTAEEAVARELQKALRRRAKLEVELTSTQEVLKKMDKEARDLDKAIADFRATLSDKYDAEGKPVEVGGAK